jgi:hypothetical protein
MKASSLFVAVLAVAILSIAPANAEKNRKVEDTYKCSTTTWPVYFGFSVQQTCSHQLRRMCEDGDGQGLASYRRLVGVQQSGVQELTNPPRIRAIARTTILPSLAGS